MPCHAMGHRHNNHYQNLLYNQHQNHPFLQCIFININPHNLHHLHQAAVALPGTWVLDSALSDLLCGDCSLPHPAHLAPAEEDHAAVVGFQQLLQPHSLMVVVDALPAALVASYSYWMCPALPPTAALLASGNLTLHLLGDSASYRFLLAALGRRLQVTFWSGTAPPATAPLTLRGGALYLGSSPLAPLLPLIHLGGQRARGAQGALPPPPSPKAMRRRMAAAFRALDQDGDGAVGAAEWGRGLTRGGLEQGLQA